MGFTDDRIQLFRYKMMAADEDIEGEIKKITRPC